MPVQPTQRLYHLGAKTRAFDALAQDLIVVAHDAQITDGAASEVTGGTANGDLAFTRLTPTASTGNERRGAHAYTPVSGKIYLLDGVEMVPTRVRRYVIFDEQAGFRELTREEAVSLLVHAEPDRSVAGSLPTLIGRVGDVARALPVRDRMLQTLPPAYTAQVRYHTYARWYLNHADRSIAELQAILDAEKTAKHTRATDLRDPLPPDTETFDGT